MSEYAQYRIEINGSNWYLYNVMGGLEASLSDTEFWGLVQSDGDDIRVFNQSSQLYFWIEYFNATEQKAIIWVNISQGSSEVNIAYGNTNATASAYNNASHTFIYYDEGDRISEWTVVGTNTGQDTSVGNPAPSYKAESVRGDYLFRRVPGLTNRSVIEYDMMTTGLGNFYVLVNSTGYGQMYRLDSRSTFVGGTGATTSWTSWQSDENGDPNIAANTWYHVKLVLNGTHLIGYVNGVQYGIRPLTEVPNNDYIGLVGDNLGAGYYSWWDNIKIYKYADPADISSTSHYDLYVQNPRLILNGNVVEYAGNLTAGSSVTLNINSTYFVQGVNTISISSDNLIYTQFDVNIKFNYTYTVLGNVTNTTVSFGTTVDYTPQLIAVVPPANRPVDSVNISVNGNAWTNFDLIGVDIHTPTTVTIKINLPDEKGVNINATVNLDPYALVIHVLDELTKRTIFPANVSVYNSTYVQLNDSVIKQVNNKYAIEYWNISDGKYHVFVDATGYSMRKRFADINTKERLDLYVYLPPSNKSIIVSFYLKDNTGRFPINSTYIIVEKSGIGKIHEEYFNVEGKVDVYLIANDVYYVYVSNGVEIKLLGTYSSSYSTTATLEIGEAVSNIIQRGVSLPMHTVTLYVIKNMKPYANIPIIVKDIYNNTYTVYTDNEGKAVIWVNKTIPYEINVNHSEKVIKAFLPLNEKYIVVVPYNTTYLNQTYKMLVNASNGSIFAIGSNLTKELSPSARGIVTALILWAVMQSAVRVVGNVSVIGLITLIILAIIGLADPISCVFAGLFVVGMYVLKRWL